VSIRLKILVSIKLGDHIMSLNLYEEYLNRFYGLLRPRFVLQDPLLSSASEKDFAYCLRRFRGEGIRYLTVTLPELRKAVDRSFETGRFEIPSTFRALRGTALPSFLFSHFARVYEIDGSFRPKPNITSLKHVRQVLEAFYKLQIPYEKSVEQATLLNYVENEFRIRDFLDDQVTLTGTPLEQELVSGAAMLCRYVFQGFAPWDIIPGNGPGRLATGELGDDKWIHTTKVLDIHRVYPYWKFFFHNVNMLADSRDEYKGLKVTPSERSKVKLVPKDSRGPRIITMEPHSYMWIQQGLRASLYEWIESTSPLTRGHINFTDQTVNQWLALNSSLTSEWATLDLKDASDLLSVDLVGRVFRLQPKLLRCLLASRTSETVLPNGDAISLKKFAGMGSAVCFPIEAFVFWAICVSAIALELGIDLCDATAFVYVYGDDIIVPTDLAEEVMTALESTGLIVNRTKSYYRGRFRESCGVEAYLQQDITPVRLKKLFPASLDDGEGFTAWCSYANSLARRGYTELSETIFKELEAIFGKIPYGLPNSPFPCRTVDDVFDAEALNKVSKIKYRYNPDLQRREYRVYHLVPVDHPSTLDGWHRLTRNLVAGAGERPSKFVLPNEVILVRGWMAI
jgi:hypothetical protein